LPVKAKANRQPSPPFEPPKNPWRQGSAEKAEDYSLQQSTNLNSTGRVETPRIQGESRSTGASKAFRSSDDRGDMTPFKLFVAGIRGWKGRLWRRLDDEKTGMQ
jgi:hypothetical protein